MSADARSGALARGAGILVEHRRGRPHPPPARSGSPPPRARTPVGLPCSPCTRPRVPAAHAAARQAWTAAATLTGRHVGMASASAPRAGAACVGMALSATAGAAPRSAMRHARTAAPEQKEKEAGPPRATGKGSAPTPSARAHESAHAGTMLATLVSFQGMRPPPRAEAARTWPERHPESAASARTRVARHAPRAPQIPRRVNPSTPTLCDHMRHSK